jgi:hypothetical protein
MRTTGRLAGAFSRFTGASPLHDLVPHVGRYRFSRPSPQGPRHAHCVGSTYVDHNARKGSGACKEADGDGDEIFTTYSFYTANTPAGAHTMIGCTGKYKGITGKMEFTPQILRGPVEGDTMFIVPHNVTCNRP